MYLVCVHTYTKPKMLHDLSLNICRLITDLQFTHSVQHLECRAKSDIGIMHRVSSTYNTVCHTQSSLRAWELARTRARACARPIAHLSVARLQVTHHFSQVSSFIISVRSHHSSCQSCHSSLQSFILSSLDDIPLSMLRCEQRRASLSAQKRPTNVKRDLL